MIGVEGGSRAAALPLLATLDAAVGQTHVCRSGSELERVPVGSTVVLLDASKQPARLNQSRPVVTERDLRVFVWPEPGDRGVLRREAPDFLDWMQQTVDVEPGPPGYVRDAVAAGLLQGTIVVLAGGASDDLLPDELPLLSATVGFEPLVQALGSGPLAVRDLPDEEAVWSLLAARLRAGSSHAVILLDPPVAPPGSEVVWVDPPSWSEAAAALEAAGVPNPGAKAAQVDLDPHALAAWTGAAAPGPVELSITTERQRWLEQVASGAIASSLGAPRSIPEPGEREQPQPDPGRQAFWEALFSAFDRAQPARAEEYVARDRVARLARRLSGPSRRRTYMLAGPPGTGKSSALEAALRALGPDTFVVRVGPRGLLRRSAGVDLDEQAFARVVAIAVLEATEEELGASWQAPLELLRKPRDTPDHRQGRVVELDQWARGEVWIRAAVEWTAEHHRRSTVIVVDDLAALPGAPLAMLDWQLLRAPPCPVLVSLRVLPALWPTSVDPLAYDVTWLPDLEVAGREDVRAPGPAVPFFRQLLEARLVPLEAAGFRVPPDLRSSWLVARLAWASGGNPGAFVRIVRDVAELAWRGTDQALRETVDTVLDDWRRTLSWGMTREQADVLKELLAEPRRLPDSGPAREALARGLICAFGEDDTWYMPHPLLLDSLS